MNIKDIKNVKKLWAFENQFAVYDTTDGKAGIINRQGEVIYPAGEYNSAFQCEDGLFMLDKYFEDGNTKRVFYNANTGETIDHDVIRIQGDYYIECTNRNYGICDHQYNTLVPMIYQGLVQWRDKFFARKENKWGLITPQGDVLLPFQYDDCTFAPGQHRNEFYQCVAQNGIYFMINEQGERLTQRDYAYLEPFNFQGFAIMRLNGCFGLIDREENIVLMTDIKGENTKNLDTRCFYWCGYNRLAFRQDGLLGIMDTKGNIIVEPQYSAIKNFYH